MSDMDSTRESDKRRTRALALERERKREREGERDHLTEKEQLDISPKGRRVRPRHSTKQALRMSRLIMSITWGQAKKSVKQAFSFLEGKAVELA